MEHSEGSTRPAGIHRIEVSVDWPPGHVSAYLVEAAEPILVDAGMPGTAAGEEFRRGLERAGRSPSEIEHVVLTHPHIDHIGQVDGLIESSSPTIYAPGGARDRLNRDPGALEGAVRRNGEEAGLYGDMLEEAVSKSVASLERNRSLLDPAQVDEWIEHDQQFTVGGLALHAIHTPGHQADHLCYDTLVDGQETLFSGDVLLEPFRSVMIHTGLDEGVEAAVPAFYRALDRLETLGSRRVYPGHGPVHDELHEIASRSRSSIERMVERTRETALDGGTTALELASKRAGDRSFHYVLPEVVSALQYLESAGEVESTLDDGVRYYHGPGDR